MAPVRIALLAAVVMAGAVPAALAGPVGPVGAAAPDHLRAAAAVVVMDMVRVGDAGNADDYTGFGAVAHAYSISRYEVTIGQYTAFLNAVAAADPYRLYHPAIARNPNIAGITRSGSPGAYTYAAMDNHGDSSDRPVTFVSWFDAARFANWMSNGQPTGAATRGTTEDGAYRLEGATSGVAPRVNAVNPNTGAPPLYRLPTEDEWYKAGYYDPSIAPDRGVRVPARNRINPNTGRPPAYHLPTEDQWYKAAYFDPSTRRGKYWAYATRSDVRPGNRVGARPNQANYNDGRYSVTQSESFSFTQNYLTDVGAFTASSSAFGTFDQNGNLFEWNDLGGRSTAARGFRGGSWYNTAGESDLDSLSRYVYDPLSASDVLGIRLAAPASSLRDARHRSSRLPVRMRLVRVGSPDNRDDPATGFGAVARAFAIGRYEVTIGQYAAFLNAVAARDPHDLFNPRMTLVGNLAGIERTGQPGSYRYSVMRNSGSSARRPIGFVSWYSAARFANWMANGQPSGRQNGRTTEDGAYRLPSRRDTARPPRPGSGGYYVYPTRSNAAPGNVIGPAPDQANYADPQGRMSTTQAVGVDPDQNYLTDVGSFTGSASHYGTFDQIGNVYEWNDVDGSASAARGIRGSCWFGTLVYAQDISKLSRGVTAADSESTSVGFRLAGP